MSAPTRFSADTTRRDFVKTGVIAGASLVIGFQLPGGARQQAAARSKDAGGDFEPNAFIEIQSNGDIYLTVARSEMGQGVRTSMAMILAEELDADWARVKIKQADFDAKYGDMTTGGSASVRSSWDPLRKAGASARDMLLTAAAQKWNVSKEECSATGGSIIEHKRTGRKLSYGELAAKAAAVPVPKDAPLKDPKDYRIVGTNKHRVDGQYIVIGEAHYGI